MQRHSMLFLNSFCMLRSPLIWRSISSYFFRAKVRQRRKPGCFPGSHETVKQQPDFSNGEACASSGGNYQVELGIGREVPLAALAGSRFS